MKTLNLEQVINATGIKEKTLLPKIKKSSDNFHKLLMPLNPDADSQHWLFSEDNINEWIKRSWERQGQAEVFTPEQLQKCINWFLAFNKPSERRNATLIATSHYTGMRCAEIAQLKISDLVDSEWQLKEEMLLHAQRTKTNKARKVALYHPKFKPIIERYLKDRRASGAKRGDNLFLTNRGKVYSRQYLANFFKKLYARYGMPEFSSHSGRRYFISQMLANGTPLKTAQKLAGHTSSMTTAIYHEPTEDEYKKAIAMVG